MKNLPNILVYLFIFLLPIQLGLHFFPSYAFIDGIRIDYLDPTLYLTDIIAVALIITNYKNIVLPKTKLSSVLIITLVINVIFSLSPLVTIYKSIKYLEIFLLFLIFSKINLKPKRLLIIFLFSTTIQVVLVLAQFLTKRSLQNVFYFLGERYFSISTPGIAKIVINGVEFLRPYGSFSHPNSLAGFFLAIHVFVLWNNAYKNTPLLKNLTLAATAILVFMSFSKITILLLAVAYVLYGFKNYKTCKICSIGKAVSMIIIAGLFLMFKGDPNTIQKRVLLMSHATQIFINNPLEGIGIGNYVIAESNFPNPFSYVFIEPVHNIFLLYLTEAGLVLTFLTGVMIFPFLKRLWNNEVARNVMMVVVVTGLFDHYWLTLQQNLLLLPVLFGLLQRHERVVE